MNRQHYEQYLECFNNKDYDGVFDFYADEPELNFFGVTIKTREQLNDFYGFLHQYVKESVSILKFASSDELTALEGIVRVEGIQDLTREILASKGLTAFFPIKKGEIMEIRQYIHYNLENGKIKTVGCALAT